MINHHLIWFRNKSVITDISNHTDRFWWWVYGSSTSADQGTLLFYFKPSCVQRSPQFSHSVLGTVYCHLLHLSPFSVWWCCMFRTWNKITDLQILNREICLFNILSNLFRSFSSLPVFSALPTHSVSLQSNNVLWLSFLQMDVVYTFQTGQAPVPGALRRQPSVVSQHNDATAAKTLSSPTHVGLSSSSSLTNSAGAAASSSTAGSESVARHQLTPCFTQPNFISVWTAWNIQHSMTHQC